MINMMTIYASYSLQKASTMYIHTTYTDLTARKSPHHLATYPCLTHVYSIHTRQKELCSIELFQAEIIG